MKKFLISLFFILVSCATARYDDPAVILKIDDSTYQIRYVGLNDSSVKLKKYVTVKAAEITLRDKYTYFELFNEKSKSTWTQNFGSIDVYEAHAKMYKQKPANLPGIYNAVEVMKNLGTKISEKDLDKKIEPAIETEDKKENKKSDPI
jgi:hypothetical protein